MPATGYETSSAIRDGGYNGDGIAATSAEINFPMSVAVDGTGNLFIADTNNHRIREVAAGTGMISTVAGTGAPGYNGDGIPAGFADLDYNVLGVAVDAAGDLFINDNGNDRVREVPSGATAVTVQQATAAVDVVDLGGAYTGDPYNATATATGVGGATVNGTFAFTYYVGSTVNGTGSSTAPTIPGTYTVTAAFTSSDSNYTNAAGGPVTFTISQTGPTIMVPTTAVLYANGSLTFSTANGDQITLTDGQAVGTSDSLTLSVSHGLLKFGSTTGLKFTSGSNHSSSMTVNGTLANLNAALQALKYTPTSGYIGADTLNLTVSDSINQQSGSASVGLTVYGPPVLSAPATAGVNENGMLVFSSANGNAITLADAAASGTSDSLVLTATHGTLFLGSTAGLTFTAGANGSASMTISGTLADLSAALDGLEYTPKTGYSGAASLTIKAKDAVSGFNTTATVAITVSIPASQPTVAVTTEFPTAVPGQPVPLVITVTDTNSTAQAADFKLVISFGDGKSATISAAPDSLIVNHVYTKTGTYTVSITATDEYGHTSSAGTTTITVVPVAVEVDPFDPSLTALFVGGTTGKDTVVFTASGNQIAVTLDKVAEGTFSTNGPLIVFGQGGADTVTVGAGVTNTSYLLETPNADNAETDLDDETIQWAGLSSAVEILNE